MILQRKQHDGIAYFQQGQGGIPVVFVHGVGLRAESWKAQLDFFAKNNDYCCYAIDLPGHGESELLITETFELTDFVNVLQGFIEKVVGSPCILVGHSLGAMTVLQTAVSYRKSVLAVAALNAIYERPKTAADAVQVRAESLLNNLAQDVSEGPIERWFDGNPAYSHQAELCRTWLNNGNRLGYARAYRMFAYLTGVKAAALAQINCPTLFLTGEFDFNSSPDMTKAMASLVDKSSAVVVANSRHMTQMTHAKAVNQALVNLFSMVSNQNKVRANI